MNAKFAPGLSPEDKKYLLDLVRSRIDLVLHDKAVGFPPLPPPGVLYETYGAFVTLKRHGKLRGCIGRLISEEPLYVTVGDMAEAAAFHDSRFPPVTMDDLADIEIEVSVMGPITRCEDPSEIVVGMHGLIMRRGDKQGLLLPQIPVEWEWDRETFLAQTCVKAGLPPDAWHDPDTEIFWFQAYVV
ncbi:MAG: hypothetical protein DELT_02696 [Desulfovibrio sp.]